MGKRIVNLLLFLAVAAAAVGMTIYVGQGASDVMVYNFVFLALMCGIYLVGMFGGMFRMNGIAAAFKRASEELHDLFKIPGKTNPKNLSYLKGIFENKYLDRKIDNFSTSIENSKEGLGEIDEYINEDELDLYIHKRLLEMVPDILTSLGILGTFIGLVWGLKNFNPNNYEAMTTSVASLVDGIKVAFLTSIYGIAFSIVYTYGMKTEYSGMVQQLQAFLERFHAYVMPTAENESRNLLLSSQKMQAQAMEKVANQISEQLAGSFEKVITPTFRKMNDSLDLMVTSVTRCQQDAIREILDAFMKEMHSSYEKQFHDFGDTLTKLNQAQKENAEYTKELYQSLSRQLSESYMAQEKTMKESITQLTSLQTRYMDSANRVILDNQTIQKMQQQDYKNVIAYLKEAEQTSAKFWVACNQAMQKYVETAASSMQNAGNANQNQTELLKANRKVVETFDAHLREFAQYQKQSYETMEQVRALLADVTLAKDRKDIYLMGGRMSQMSAQNDALEKLQDIMEAQGERQEKLLEEMTKNMRDLTRAAQKGKFSLFK